MKYLFSFFLVCGWVIRKVSVYFYAVSPWVGLDLFIFFESIDLSRKRVFEVGSGDSTLWFGCRSNSVFSIEEDSKWCEIVSEKTASFDNVAVVEVSRDETKKSSLVESGVWAEFMAADIVFVDGGARARWVELFFEYRPFGILIIDDADAYSIAPFEMGDYGYVLNFSSRKRGQVKVSSSRVYIFENSSF